MPQGPLANITKTLMPEIKMYFSKKMNEYFAKGYHDLAEFHFGFKADYYNKLFMKNLHYLEERAE